MNKKAVQETTAAWQGKREERFRRWLAAGNADFISAEAGHRYTGRVSRFIQAIRLEEPDRVPVLLPTGWLYPAFAAGISTQTFLRNTAEMRRAWLGLMKDFPDMDTYHAPIRLPTAYITDRLQSEPTDDTEYLKADEYDEYLHDAGNHALRKRLPRAGALLAPLADLPTEQGRDPAVAWTAMFNNPGIREAFQALMDLAKEAESREKIVRGIREIIVREGYPCLLGTTGTGAPFEVVADTLRGTRGTVKDMYSQPERLIETMERLVPDIIEELLAAAEEALSPVIFLPLRRCDEVFLSEAQFARFYWPTFRQVLAGIIEEGYVPFPFTCGACASRLPYFADLPEGGVIWGFDKTDMGMAKEALGGTACIAGNVPATLVAAGTPGEVGDYCGTLIETCGPGGGFILTGGAFVDKGNPANLQAMIDAAKK